MAAQRDSSAQATHLCNCLVSHRLSLSSQVRIISVWGKSSACCRQQDYAADVRIASQGASTIPSEALSFGEYNSSDVFQSHARVSAQSNGTLQLQSSDLSMLPSLGTASLGSGTPPITQDISSQKTFFAETTCTHQDAWPMWLHRRAADDSMNWYHHYPTPSRLKTRIDTCPAFLESCPTCWCCSAYAVKSWLWLCATCSGGAAYLTFFTRKKHLMQSPMRCWV